MRTIYSRAIFLVIFITALATGCSKKSSSPGDLLGSSQLDTITTAQTGAVFSGIGAPITAIYDVANYKLEYVTTDPGGNLIAASGVLSVPQKQAGNASPIFSYQHGTIFTNGETPSNAVAADEAHILAASLGVISSVPDYLGFGSSHGTTDHPYSHSKTLASSSIDMLRAAKKFLDQAGTSYNQQLFLAGYSEGGKATLAMQREIETNLADEFSVTASIPGSGNYDMSAMTLGILASIELPYPAFVAWVIKAYEDIYNLNKLEEIIAAPYVDAVRTSFDGIQTGEQINAKLTAVTSKLINQSFIDSYFAGTEPEMAAAAADNNDFDWKPTAITHLFHGQQDATVPYINSQNAYNKMIANGATTVQLINCDAGGQPTTHSGCGLPYLNYVLGVVTTLAQDL